MIIINNDRIKLKFFSFPAGERHCKLQQDSEMSDFCYIKAILKSPSDIIDLLLSADALRREGCRIHTLKLHYFPYAQQDRINDRGEPLSSKVIADLINGLNIGCVEIYDPHSDVVPALLNNCVVIDNASLANFAIELFQPDFLICPDVGAKKKLEKISKMFNLPITYCDKTRDVKTGKLTGFKIISHPLTEGKRGLVIDDICVGGGTFLGVRKLFNNDYKISLAVSHGIFSNGLDDLKSNFDGIYTTDSYYDGRDKYVKVFNI